jgi:Putative zinc-finger
MEQHAPLRPVPGRPSEPVSEPEAVARVAAALPALGERERVALALAGLAGTARPLVAARLGVDEAELAVVLAAARKELRRTMSPLPGSGWCERAERLISDRMDGALAPADVPRLDAHQRNCPRCVEHERRLVQATDALTTGAAPAPSAPVVADAPPAAEPPTLVPSPAPSEPVAVEAPGRRGARELAGAIGWTALIVFAVLLALAALGLALAGALGAQL